MTHETIIEGSWNRLLADVIFIKRFKPKSKKINSVTLEPQKPIPKLTDDILFVTDTRTFVLI